MDRWGKSEAKTVREMINKENELINHRLTWFIAFQSLLFVALSFAWKDAKELIWAFVLIGVGISLSSFIATIFSDKAIQQLSIRFNKEAHEYSGPPVIAYDARCCLKYLLPWFAVPVLFAIGWFVILLRS